MNILVTSLPDINKIRVQRPHYILNHLSRNHSITVLCINAWWLRPNNIGDAEYMLQDIDSLYLCNLNINPFLQELFSSFKIFIDSKDLDLESFDIHINFNSLVFGYFMSKQVHQLGIPTIFDICDDIPELIYNSPRVPFRLRRFGKLLGKIMLTKNIQTSRMISFVTKGLNETYNFPIDKSMLIPNGVSSGMYKRTSHIDDEKKKFNICVDDLVIGFIGVLSEWVDLEPVYSALRNLRERIKIKLIIVGEGEKLSYYKNLSSLYGLSNHVIFAGLVSYEEGPKMISLMDICLIPRKTTQDSNNSLPLKLFEYMSCEKPVISTPLKGVFEAVGNRVLYASDSNEIENLIIELYKNKSLRLKLGKQGRMFVEEHYDWSRICPKFEGLLKSIDNHE